MIKEYQIKIIELLIEQEKLLAEIYEALAE